MTTDFTHITEAQWLSLDDKAIAKLIKCHQRTVSRKRKELGHPAVRKTGSGRKPTFNLKRFKLDRTNNENAEALGISPQRAGQIRKQLTKKDEWI